MTRSTMVLQGWRRSGVAVAALTLAAAACIADDPDPRAIDIEGDGEFTMVMNEFAYEPSRITVDPGSTIKITLFNEGFIEHELMVGRLAMAEGGYQTDLLAPMLAGESVTGVSFSLPSDPEHDAPEPEESCDEASPAPDHDDAGTAPHSHDEPTDSEEPSTSPECDDTSDEDDSDPGAATPDGDPAGDQHSDTADAHDESDGHHDEDGGGHGGAHLLLQPGETIEIVIVVPPDASGEWEIGCFLEGHYEAGMKGTLTIRDRSA